MLALLAAGVMGDLLKNESLAAITAAVRAVAQGERRLRAAVAASVVDYRVHGTAESAPRSLSAREREVLRLLACGNSNQEIATALAIMERTVSFHLSTINGKLGLRNRGEAIAWAIRHGFGAD